MEISRPLKKQIYIRLTVDFVWMRTWLPVTMALSIWLLDKQKWCSAEWLDNGTCYRWNRAHEGENN